MWGRAEKTQYAYGRGSYRHSSRREKVFLERSGSYDTRRENEEVSLSVFIWEGGHMGTEGDKQKSTGD